MMRNIIFTMDDPRVKSMLSKSNIRPHNNRKETNIHSFKKKKGRQFTPKNPYQELNIV